MRVKTSKGQKAIDILRASEPEKVPHSSHGPLKPNLGSLKSALSALDKRDASWLKGPKAKPLDAIRAIIIVDRTLAKNKWKSRTFKKPVAVRPAKVRDRYAAAAVLTLASL